MKWVCFPKFYSPLANWPWLRISPQSSLNIIYCLILTAWQWLMSFTCIPVQIEPTKTHWGKGSWPFSFERSAPFPPQADHVLVDLFSSAADGGLCGQSPPPQRITWWTSIHRTITLLQQLSAFYLHDPISLPLLFCGSTAKQSPCTTSFIFK